MKLRNFCVMMFGALMLSALQDSRMTAAEEEPAAALRRSLTFYASFDEAVRGDFGGGGMLPSTRFDHPTEKNAFVFEPSFDPAVFRIAKDKGVRGAALECVDVLPRRGRIFFPLKDNLAFRDGGWGGSASFWLNTDPNHLLKTPFCDPIQITEKGANNGGVWCDFPDSTPRDMRLGAFPGAAEGGKPILESDPAAPLVVARNVGFQYGKWHHVAMTWNRFDTGRPDAEAELFIDGKSIGRLADREIAMRWNVDAAGIYVAVNYIGLLDELALFDRPLTADEVRFLHEHPNFDHRGREPAAQLEFQPSIDFVKLPADMKLGACSAVAVNRQGEIFLFHRGKQPIIVLDAKGNYLRSWGDGEIETAHGLRIDREDNVWVTDIGAHRVLKFDPRGKLLLALGTGQPGAGDDQFNKPTDIAFGPRGEVFITDGYGNSRVVKSTPGGRRIGAWGTAGKGRGEFNIPHSIVIDARGRVLVGDRENDRIQIFDQDGRLLDIWPGFAPFGLTLAPDGHLFVADGRAHKILRLDDGGRVVQSWGEMGSAPGQFQLPHMLGLDLAGNLYIAEITGQRFQRLVLK